VRVCVCPSVWENIYCVRTNKYFIRLFRPPFRPVVLLFSEFWYHYDCDASQGLLSLPSPGVGKWVPVIAGKAYVTAGRQLWLIPIADERVGMQVKLWDPLRTRAIPERFCGGDSLRRGAISSVCTFTFYLYYRTSNTNTMSWNVPLPHLSDL